VLRPTIVGDARRAQKNRRGSTKQIRAIRRLHRHMKRDTTSLVAATFRTGFLVGFAILLILVLFPAAMAQAAGLR
jgi:hypothetical protein